MIYILSLLAAILFTAVFVIASNTLVAARARAAALLIGAIIAAEAVSLNAEAILAFAEANHYCPWLMVSSGKSKSSAFTQLYAELSNRPIFQHAHDACAAVADLASTPAGALGLTVFYIMLVLQLKKLLGPKAFNSLSKH